LEFLTKNPEKKTGKIKRRYSQTAKRNKKRKRQKQNQPGGEKKGNPNMGGHQGWNANQNRWVSIMSLGPEGEQGGQRLWVKKILKRWFRPISQHSSETGGE